MIVLSDVGKSFGSVKAVDHVSLTVTDAECLGIVGPSGSGKTTLLRLIAGLEAPDTGIIHIDGRPVSSPKHVVAPHQRSIGFVFQQPALWPHLTVAQNILFGLSDLRRAEAYCLAGGKPDGSIEVWNCATEQRICLRQGGHSSAVTAVAISPDGHRVASAEARRKRAAKVHLWDVASLRMIHELTAPKPIVALAFSPSGKVIAGGGHGFVTIWNAESGQEVRTFDVE